MKLLTRFSIYNVLFSLLVLTIGGILIYHFLYRISNHEIDKSLHQDIVTAIGKLEAGISASELETSFLHISEAVPNLVSGKTAATDTVIYNPRENEFEPYRILKATRSVNNHTYALEVMQPMMERDDVILTIFLSTLAVFLILVLLSSLSNIFISRRLWKPFRETIESIRRYRLSSDYKFKQTDTNVNEFRELSEYVGEMIGRIENEYNTLKEFTANASHEMQTPLAVIRSKIELLSQSDQISHDNAEHLLSMNQAVARMTKLFRALLLLTKLENRQFEETSDVDLNMVINQLIGESEEFIQQKKLKIEYHNEEKITAQMNPDLAKIMLQNLISNAIRHNEDGGTIRISTYADRFIISNTGPLIFHDNPDQVFERFKKNPTQKGSIGLGLSVVRKICDLYEFKIQYTYKDQFHHFEIDIPI